MNDILHRLRSLKKAERRIAPDAAWMRATRASLVAHMQGTISQTERISVWQRMRATLGVLTPTGMGTWVHRPMIAMMSIVAMLTGGSIMSVSAAEQALPGDFLYNLKLATEQARLAFTPVSSEKLQLKTEFTTRRIDELKAVADDSERPDRVEQVAEILKRDLDTLQQQLDDVVDSSSDEEAVAAAKLVDHKSSEVITELQTAKSQVSLQSIEKITEAQSAAADTGLKAISVLAQQHEQSNDMVPAADVTQAIQDHVKVISDATSSTTSLASNREAGTATGTQTIATLATSSTIATSTSSLPLLIEQVKTATTQAFTQQKAKDALGASGSSTPMVLTSGTSTTDAKTQTTTSTTSPQGGSATSSVSVSSTGTVTPP